MANEKSEFGVKLLTKVEAVEMYPELWLTAEELLFELTGDQLAIVVSIAVDTCGRCRSDNANCQCWNDE